MSVEPLAIRMGRHGTVAQYLLLQLLPDQLWIREIHIPMVPLKQHQLMVSAQTDYFPARGHRLRLQPAQQFDALR
ncbi:hypothetical protein LBMAG56_51680 [Verrucomicrobiota bacterium]|nr:hypothetical protein LBMAG56_51680 [Verrucomicrobiota bacterium]